MKRTQEVKLSREEGEALIERLAGDALTVEDRHVLVEEALGRIDGGKIAGGR